MPRNRKFYLCGVDYQHEIGEASDLEGRMPMWSSIEELKKAKPCWEECGIVEIVIEDDKVTWVAPQEF